MRVLAGKESRLGAWVWPLAFLGLAYMAACVRAPLNFHDEGYSAYCAGRMADGAVPVRDFFTIYSPGVFYLESWVFRAAGPQLWVLRCGDLCVRCVLAWCAGWGARRAGAGAWSWLALGLVWLFLGPMGFFGYSAVPGFLFCLLAGLAWTEFLGRGRLAFAAAAGALAGLTAFFRQDFGMYIGLAAGFCAVVMVLIEPEGRGLRVRGMVLFCGTAGLVLALTLSQCLWEAGPAAVWRQLVVVPLSPIMGGMRLVVPGLADPFQVLGQCLRIGAKKEMKALLIWLALYLSAAALAAGGLVSLNDLVRRMGRRREALCMLLFSALGVLALKQAFNRADLPHFFPVLTLSWMLLLALLSRPFWRLAALSAALAMVLAFGGLSLMEWGSLFLPRPLEEPSPLARAKGLLVRRDLDVAVAMIDGYTAPGQKIYVATPSDNGIRYYNLMFYFLADRAEVSPNEFGDVAGTRIGDIRAAVADPATAALVVWRGSWWAPAADPEVEDALKSFGPLAWSSGDYEIRVPAAARREKLTAAAGAKGGDS